MYKILIPEDIAESGKQFLSDRGYSLKIGVPTDIQSLKKELMDADGVIVRNARYPREVFESSERLKVIARHGTGTDNIDVEAAKKQGIWVVNGPTANINAVAEYTVSVIAALSCNLRLLDLKTRAGDWSCRLTMKRREIKSSAVGLIGFGHVGQLVAKKLTAGFGVKVLAYELHTRVSPIPGAEISTDLDYVLSNSDFVSLHIPLTASTKGMFNYDMFSRMKKDSFFINCARGDLYVEEDLIRALEEGHLAGAALDVYPEEPLKNSRLYDMEQVLLSQHNAGISEESKVNMSLYAAMGIDQVLTGQSPSWPVNHPNIPTLQGGSL